MGHQWSRFAMPSAAVMLRGTCFAGAAGGDSGGRRRGGGGIPGRRHEIPGQRGPMWTGSVLAAGIRGAGGYCKNASISGGVGGWLSANCSYLTP
jgi:hypothetical protein